MEKIERYIFGAFAIVVIAVIYAIYMIFGPGGDGPIFGSVLGAIGLITGGIAGFEYVIKKNG